MSALSSLLAAVVAHGPMLLLGTTVVLAGGCLAMLLHRDPAQRRRLGITTACGCLGYLALALVPLPRVFGTAPDAEPTAATEPPAAAVPLDPDVRAQALLGALDRVLGAPAPATAVAPAGTSAAPLPQPAAPRSEPLPWPTALAIVWCLGACLVLLRAAWGLVCLRILLRRSRAAPGTLRNATALPRHVAVRIARTSVRPFCTGWLRPVVVLGPELLEPRRAAQALAVVRHEAAHLRARDPLVQLLLAALAVPLFCHPLFWWLCRQVRFCSELLADDAAAAASRTAYARELIDLAGRDQPTLAAAGAIAVFHRPSDFYRRIQMLLQREGPLSTSTSRARRATHALATLSLVAAAAGLFGVPASAQEPRGRELRKENEALRAELDELRAQIARLRDELQGTVGNPPPVGAPGLGTPGLVPNGAPGLGAPGLAPNGATGLGAPGLAPSGGVAGPGVSDYRVPGQQPALPTPAELRDTYARIERQAALERDQDALSRFIYGPGTAPQQPGVGAPPSSYPSQLPGAGAPGPGGARAGTGPTGEVPLLADMPVLDRMFVAGPDGLPNQAVNVLPPERTATVATTEAIADLVSRCLDLQADLEIAEVTAADATQLAEQGLASMTEVKKAAVTLRTLQKKLGIVKKLIAGEMEATHSEMQWLERKRAEADKTDRLRLDMQMHRARMRLEALEAVK